MHDDYMQPYGNMDILGQDYADGNQKMYVRSYCTQRKDGKYTKPHFHGKPVVVPSYQQELVITPCCYEEITFVIETTN